MTFSDEFYFEITLTGAKSEIKKLVQFIKSGELDDFFEVDSDFISYDDSFFDVSDSEETSMVFSNDDYGIEINEFEAEDFLDTFCRAAKNLDVSGTLYDINDEEYNFRSEEGNSYYIDKSKVISFNEDEDKEIEANDDEEEEE